MGVQVEKIHIKTNQPRVNSLLRYFLKVIEVIKMIKGTISLQA